MRKKYTCIVCGDYLSKFQIFRVWRKFYRSQEDFQDFFTDYFHDELNGYQEDSDSCYSRKLKQSVINFCSNCFKKTKSEYRKEKNIGEIQE